ASPTLRLTRTSMPKPAQRGLPRTEARRRVGEAAATWLGLSLASISAVSALVVWHLVRRGRLIRERLPPPRIVPDLDDALNVAEPGSPRSTNDR
ncbi:MAG TPA: hypothetical protein VGZ22_19330, partial [Isosphaeraceae bacterium]|nr:hypothetical protein [Isosphaeraceae bacterium]